MVSKVFGLGLSKTGTKTLGSALTALGYRGTNFDKSLLLEWSKGKYENIWHKIDQFDSFNDWPYPLFYQDIMNRFQSDAFYIVTIRRDAQTWLKSLKQHALRGDPANAAYREIAYGISYPHLDETKMIDRYNKHPNDVLDTAKRLGLNDRVRIMCWETGDGWNELCGFLSKAVPAVPFPHKNSAESIETDESFLRENTRIILEENNGADIRKRSFSAGG